MEVKIYMKLSITICNIQKVLTFLLLTALNTDYLFGEAGKYSTFKAKKAALIKMNKSLDNFYNLRTYFIETLLNEKGEEKFIGDGFLTLEIKDNLKLRMIYHGNMGKIMVCNSEKIIIKKNKDVFPLTLSIPNLPLLKLLKKPAHLERFLYSNINLEIYEKNELIYLDLSTKATKSCKNGFRIILLFQKTNFSFAGWISYNKPKIGSIIKLKNPSYNLKLHPDTFTKILLKID